MAGTIKHKKLMFLMEVYLHTHTQNTTTNIVIRFIDLKQNDNKIYKIRNPPI